MSKAVPNVAVSFYGVTGQPSDTHGPKPTQGPGLSSDEIHLAFPLFVISELKGQVTLQADPPAPPHLPAVFPATVSQAKSSQASAVAQVTQRRRDAQVSNGAGYVGGR